MSTIGNEQELHTTKNGYLIDGAPLLLAYSTEFPWLVKEGSRAQIEVNTRPTGTIHEQVLEISEKLRILEYLSAEHNLELVAASSYGSGRGTTNRPQSRFPFYDEMFGLEDSDNLVSIIGNHTHLSQPEGEEAKVKQQRLLLGLEPLTYAFTSTSPMRYDGVNTLNNHRIPLVRNMAVDKFPEFAAPQPYPQSMENILSLGERLVNTMVEVGKSIGYSEEDTKQIFNADNTGYIPLRFRTKFPTQELRSADSAPLPYQAAIWAILKGVNDYVEKTGIPVEVGPEYYFGQDKIILPENKKSLEIAIIEKGLEHHPTYGNLAKDYASAAIGLARRGLPEEDLHYLNLAEKLVESGMNPASHLNRYMHTNFGDKKRFSPAEAAQGMLFMREMYKEGLNNPLQLPSGNYK